MLELLRLCLLEPSHNSICEQSTVPPFCLPKPSVIGQSPGSLVPSVGQTLHVGGCSLTEGECLNPSGTCGLGRIPRLVTAA